MKILRFTDKELDFLKGVLKEQERQGLEYSNSFDSCEYENMLIKLNMPCENTKCYVVVVTHDNSFITVNKIVICRAVDENDAFNIVKSTLERSSFDTVILVSVTEIDDSCVYVCHDEIKK